MKSGQLGHWAFILGVILAILAGFAGTDFATTIAIVLIILGIIVGFLNISQKEMTEFLVAAIALLATGAAGLDKLPVIGVYLGAILINLSAFVGPAAVIVALKAVYELGKRK